MKSLQELTIIMAASLPEFLGQLPDQLALYINTGISCHFAAFYGVDSSTAHEHLPILNASIRLLFQGTK